MGSWDRFICVDWGKDVAKRQAWVADIAARTVAPLDVTLSVAGLTAAAHAMSGRTVVAIDAVLGIPRFYAAAAAQAFPQWASATTFPSWLALAASHPDFLLASGSAASWRHDRPFIAVPKGAGSLKAFWARSGGRLLRDIDVSTGAKSPFIVSGIPGTVGSGTRYLWSELASLRLTSTDVAIWPFDGALSTIDRRVALAEIYPRVCYALALASALPSRLLRLAKTKEAVRSDAVDKLQQADWVKQHAVSLSSPQLARDNEDHFDAMMSAAGLLRCVLDGHPLEGPVRDQVEGGILGLAAIC
jgi:hypothetical protein